MKITDTRKAIIELILDYMDKTLSEWCLLKNEKFWFAKIEFWNKETSLEWKMIALITWKIDWITIWHYDITVVFSFIDKQWFYISHNWRWEFRIYDWENNTKWFIKNKPLHLYTEEEDKQLLDLLLKIK